MFDDFAGDCLRLSHLFVPPPSTLHTPTVQYTFVFPLSLTQTPCSLFFLTFLLLILGTGRWRMAAPQLPLEFQSY